MTKKGITSLFMVLLSLGIFAQRIENVTMSQKDQQLIVTYDLQGSDSYTFDVELYYSTNGGQSFKGPVTQVFGDVGEKVEAGSNKKITWQVLNELPYLHSNRVVFKVVATVGSQLPAPIQKLINDMVEVQGGTFTMGCTSEQSDCSNDEKPPHSVTLSSFSIGKYEVTQAQWRAVMGADPPELHNKGCDQCPVERVSWEDIVNEFLPRLNRMTGKNFRLPTEAEWEYAARGGNKSKGYKYAGSNSIGSVAWYDNNAKSGNTHGSQKTTRPVGQKSPNELGLYDMSGNVWEWCSDWYDGDYYENSPRNNPKGPSSGLDRVLRGGSWYGIAEYCRVAYRDSNHPRNRNFNNGFRLVLSQ